MDLLNRLNYYNILNINMDHIAGFPIDTRIASIIGTILRNLLDHLDDLLIEQQYNHNEYGFSNCNQPS